jgi:hypothetical protein
MADPTSTTNAMFFRAKNRMGNIYFIKVFRMQIVARFSCLFIVILLSGCQKAPDARAISIENYVNSKNNELDLALVLGAPQDSIICGIPEGYSLNDVFKERKYPESYFDMKNSSYQKSNSQDESSFAVIYKKEVSFLILQHTSFCCLSESSDDICFEAKSAKLRRVRDKVWGSEYIEFAGIEIGERR